MTVAAAAALAPRPSLPRSATLGAVVLMAGLALVYWALIRSRGGKGLFGMGANATTGGSFLDAALGTGPARLMSDPIPKDAAAGGTAPQGARPLGRGFTP